VVDLHGDGRLEIAPRHRRVDQEAHVTRLDARLGHRLGAGLDGGVVEVRSRGPPPALGHARHALEESLGETQPLQAGGKPFVELCGTDDYRRLHTRDGEQGRVVMSEGRVTGQISCLVN